MYNVKIWRWNAGVPIKFIKRQTIGSRSANRPQSLVSHVGEGKIKIHIIQNLGRSIYYRKNAGIGEWASAGWLAPADYFLPKGSSFREVERFERSECCRLIRLSLSSSRLRYFLKQVHRRRRKEAITREKSYRHSLFQLPQLPRLLATFCELDENMVKSKRRTVGVSLRKWHSPILTVLAGANEKHRSI